MERLFIDLNDNSYMISIDRGLLGNLQDFLGEGDRWVIVTDENVDVLYGQKLMQLLKDRKVEKIVIPSGEGSKNLQTVEYLLKTMLEYGLTRRSKVIALGGGVVGDIAGFCASIYMRGIPFIQVPTTLLAQVDSSVGGKTGVNMPQGKNIVGSFYQPQTVVIDVETLSTLSKRELISGIGEVIKYGIIYDYNFLEYINKNLSKLFALEEEVIIKVIKRCCEIKAEVVSKDEKEEGLRKILNYGHTIGHALETATHYKNYTHGEAVLIGMYYEALMAKKLGYIDESYYKQISETIRKTGISLEIYRTPLPVLIDCMMKDKKNKDGKISFILPEGKGKVTEVLLTREEIISIA
ncbi:3-dehydroquinate synthase [Anaerovirgula multivorans]|uniref:3-dehydroquinate synthase n=1 Tax=Anaerovirgula multivorans TaxID=312168 RepID=A0A239HJ78_9FIRM|nr:3-dehydroquinate synthase [Anaerovirgula multivorans]SNS81372.1 3-dehydroquinate synthase [Anaerovirgula multivorans]